MPQNTNEPIFQPGGIKRLSVYLVMLVIFFAISFHFMQSL